MERKGAETKMYNRMYWNDIVQLIFLTYTYITFLLCSMLLVLHNIQKDLQHVTLVLTARRGVLLPLKLPWFHADIKTYNSIV